MQKVTPSLKKRKSLNEGRSSGIGFGFVKKTSRSFELVQAISPCKDYLNDVVYSEVTGKDIYAYGFSYKKCNIFSDVNYIAFAICKSGAIAEFEYPNYKKDIERLMSNLDNLQLFLNLFEDLLNIPIKTKLTKCDNDIILAEISNDWCKYPYLISLWSLLVRVGVYWKQEDTILDFLNSTKYDPTDVYIVKNVIPKIKKLSETGFVEQVFKNGGTSVHNEGISNFQI